MAVRYNKIFLPDEIYFVTFTILGWKNVFISDKYCDLIYRWFDYLKKNYDNEIHAYVIMPNHIHLLLYVSNKSPELSKVIQNSKRFLAYQIIQLLEEEKKTDLLYFFEVNARKESGAKHKVFEDGYDSLVIQSRKLFLEKLNYIHYNPCQEKFDLVDSPEDYKYSSAGNYILGGGKYNISLIDF